jgi:hypothetical protein
LDCVALGDEVAAAIGNELSCEIRAATGLTSSRVLDIANGKFHVVCIVSIGQYDTDNYSVTYKNASSIRNQAPCKTYVWIQPANRQEVFNNIYLDHPLDSFISNYPVQNTNSLVNEINKVTDN